MREIVDGYNRSYRILIADDDQIIRDTVELTMKAYGYEIVSVDDGMTAWNTVLAEPIDLVLMDLNMPGLDGYDFVARVRLNEDLANLPIVILSGATGDEACDRAFGLGATGYLMKPINWPLLAHTVWYVLRNEAREAEMRMLKAQGRMHETPSLIAGAG